MIHFVSVYLLIFNSIYFLIIFLYKCNKLQMQQIIILIIKSDEFSVNRLTNGLIASALILSNMKQAVKTEHIPVQGKTLVKVI